jgi:uroporphyrinogen decarboxylase
MENSLRLALDGRRPGAIPFVPAVYEHKAWFIGKTPSEVCRDEDLLVDASIAEEEALRPDGMIVGIDVYNIEAEAVGCAVTYPAAGATGIPALAPGGEALGEDAPVEGLRLPDPGRDGRMPMMIRATERIHAIAGSRLCVMAAATAPFSLAASIAGPSNLFMAMVSDPGRAGEIIEFSTRVVERYCEAFARRGIMVALFDSHASPGLISPRRYREFAMAPARRVIDGLRRAGIPHVPLIIGGNTDSIIEDYAGTGGDFLLCDGPSSTARFLEVCARLRRAFRKNIPSDLIAAASPGEIRARTKAELETAGRYPGFILGTGIIPYGTPTERVLAVGNARAQTGE